MPEGSVALATWFHQDNATEWGSYAQVRGSSDNPAVHLVYKRVLCVYFHLARVFVGPDIPLVLVTNADDLGYVDGRRVADVLEVLNVQVLRRQFGARPPDNWYRTWRNQFYVIDAVDAIAGQMGGIDGIVLTDADCLVRGSLTEISRQIMTDGSLAYVLPFEPEHSENGLRVADLSCLAQELGWPSPVGYCGGEFIGLRADRFAAFLKGMRAVQAMSTAAFEEGRLHAREEAHMWSLTAALLGANPAGDRFIRRIWTSAQYRDVLESDQKRPLWHTPSEKMTGIRRIWSRHTRHLRNAGQLGDPAVLRHDLRRLIGVPDLSASKRVTDWSLRARHRAELLQLGRRPEKAQPEPVSTRRKA